MLKELAAAVLLIASTGTVRAGEQIVPSWMTIDAGAKKVEMDVIAGFNPNNNNWNFNGYYEGSLTVVVPEGWRVQIEFTNRDANYPHSLVVIEDPGDANYPHSLVVIEDPGSEDELPEQAGREDVAIKRAYSKSPIEGIFSNDEDTISFAAAPAGDYLFYCGVPAHGLSGMWVYFKISADADQPYAIIAEGAEEGRT